MKDLVSIIIPVYNSEETIGRLITIIQKQTYKNIEIIIVNDGSKDNTMKVISDIVGTDERFKIFSKVNEGVSVARNFGLLQATGEYVAFADADDLFFCDTIQNLLEKIKRTSSDFSIGKYTKDSFVENSPVTNINKASIDKNEIKYKILYPNKDINYENINFRTVWGKLYKRKILEEFEIFFPTGLKLFEDGLFNLYYLENIDKVSILDQFVYIYSVSETSAVHKTYTDMYDIFIQINQTLDFIYRKYELAQTTFRDYLNCCLFEFISQLLINNSKLGFKSKDTYRQIKEEIDVIISEIIPNKLTLRHRVVFYLLKYRLFPVIDFLILAK
ncbi:glycosyltransferase family 2 protein [Streptococcus suis]